MAACVSTGAKKIGDGNIKQAKQNAAAQMLHMEDHLNVVRKAISLAEDGMEAESHAEVLDALKQAETALIDGLDDLSAKKATPEY